jgi:membrane protein implicated in regulation of membrane protease activity
MFEWLGQNWWALWLTLFLVFAAVEMLTLDLFFIMLGGGALAGLVADFAGADFWLQIVVFCVVSLLMIAFVRPVTLKHLHKGPARTAHQHRPPDRRIGARFGGSYGHRWAA